MSRFLRTGAVVALSAFALVNCGGDQKPAETPEPTTSAEPPLPPEADAGTTPTSSNTNSPTDDSAGAKAEAPDVAPDPKAEPLTDEQIAAITDAANSAEIAQAKLAQGKSKDPGIKRFAAMMIKHHGEAKQKQTKLKLKGAESSISTALESDATSTLNALKGDKGADFDKAYISAQVQEHQNVLDTINQKLLPNAKNADLRAYLDEIKPRVEEHLKQAKQLQEELDAKNQSASIAPPHKS
jgi:putative membrane protein